MFVSNTTLGELCTCLVMKSSHKIGTPSLKWGIRKFPSSLCFTKGHSSKTKTKIMLKGTSLVLQLKGSTHHKSRHTTTVLKFMGCAQFAHFRKAPLPFVHTAGVHHWAGAASQSTSFLGLLISLAVLLLAIAEWGGQTMAKAAVTMRSQQL